MKKAIQLIAGVLLITSGCLAQNIPSTIWGKWIVQRELPTRTVSCWGEEDAKKIIGTQIEYSDKVFRWKGIAKQATEISIHHEPANITGATIEIPGDSVLVKDANTIIFSVCNTYFEAKRIRDNRQDPHAGH
jgi:hypothetical protein